jgi:Tfp pilus assembly major pilin PilA
VRIGFRKGVKVKKSFTLVEVCVGFAVIAAAAAALCWPHHKKTVVKNDTPAAIAAPAKPVALTRKQKAEQVWTITLRDADNKPIRTINMRGGDVHVQEDGRGVILNLEGCDLVWEGEYTKEPAKE